MLAGAANPIRNNTERQDNSQGNSLTPRLIELSPDDVQLIGVLT